MLATPVLLHLVLVNDVTVTSSYTKLTAGTQDEIDYKKYIFWIIFIFLKLIKCMIDTIVLTYLWNDPFNFIIVSLDFFQL